ncbi:MAG: flagellar biosynthetic protein FliO [Acidobacteriota bacterium]
MVYCLILQQLDPTQPGAVSEPILGDSWTLLMMVLKMGLMLGGVCLLMFVLLRYGLPRFVGMQAPGAGLMRVIARFPLETQKTLYIVEAAGKHLLLGVTQERIEVLSELPSEAIQAALDAAAVAEPTPVARLGSSAVKEFSKYLRRERP